MEPFVRRSHLLVSARDEAQVDMSWQHAADAVILDLTDTVPDIEKPHARANIKAAIPVAARGGARTSSSAYRSPVGGGRVRASFLRKMRARWTLPSAR